MEIKALFGILSSIFVFVGGIPYLIDIHKKKVSPHILSWTGWAFVLLIGSFSMVASGSQWVVASLFANSLLCLLVAIYSIIKKVGVWSTTIYDYIFFGFGILGLILWQILNLPILALILSIFADFCFAIPTVIKTYKNPGSETYFVWLLAVIAEMFAIFAINSFTFNELAFNTYLFFLDLTVLLLVLKVIKKK